MSQANGITDPRSNVTHPIDTGQVYKTTRTDTELTLVFLSEDAVLLKDNDGYHRLETRRDFEANVGSGRYTLQSDASSGSVSSKLTKLKRLLEQYEDESGRTAAHKQEAIEEAIELIENNGRPDDNETIPFEDIDGIGQKAASSLRAAGFSTKGDVRAAEQQTIEDVSYMGSKNTEALLDFVNNE